MHFYITENDTHAYDITFINQHPFHYVFTLKQYENFFHIPDITTSLKKYHGFTQFYSKISDSIIAFHTKQDAQFFIDDFLTPYLVMIQLTQ